MNPRQQAVLDIQDDLRKEGKAFIAFRRSLNPVMRHLTHEYLKTKGLPKVNKTQLVAHCFFAFGNVEYSNYEKYYG